MEFLYTPAKYQILSQNLNLITGSVKAMLVTPDYLPDPSQEFVDDGTISAASEFEISGTGYIDGFGGGGRKLLANKQLVEDDSFAVVRYIFDDLSWLGLNAGIVGGIVLILESGTSDATSRLIAYRNSGGLPQLTDGSEFRVLINQTLGFFNF